MAEELEQSKESAKELKVDLQDINKEAAQARQTFNDIAANLGKAAAKNKEFAAGFKTAQKDVQDLSAVSAKLIVPLVVIVPPSKPVPAVIEVTLPAFVV